MPEHRDDRRGRAANPVPEQKELEVALPDDDLLEFEDAGDLKARIRVVGVGGAGGNALDTMIRSNLGGCEFIVANTDAQALVHKLAPVKVQLGVGVTRGLGCGANPERGRAAAMEDRERLRSLLEGSDMVFVTAGMGGGTGTGAAPVIAEVARELGALTVGVVTKPFPFEGRHRMRHAERGLDELHRVVDTLITIPNQRLLALAGKDTPMMDSFRLADEVLLNAVRGISDLITVHGLINLDFADVRTIMNEMGLALMGTGVGVGESRAKDAAFAAISSPLLEDVSIEGARGVLINITGGADMTLWEVNEASSLVQEAAHEDANIIFGAVIDDKIAPGEIRVTVIATGLDDDRARVGDDRDRERERDRRGREPERDRERDRGSVAELRPLRREAPAAPPPPAAREAAPAPAPAPQRTEAKAEDFVSPFEDELDIPTFLRRRREEASADDDREVPAFLRRSAD
jgi:cell division protein FtsZ